MRGSVSDYIGGVVEDTQPHLYLMSLSINRALSEDTRDFATSERFGKGKKRETSKSPLSGCWQNGILAAGQNTSFKF